MFVDQKNKKIEQKKNENRINGRSKKPANKKSQKSLKPLKLKIEDF
jgi:hypothetical protein